MKKQPKRDIIFDETLVASSNSTIIYKLTLSTKSTQYDYLMERLNSDQVELADQMISDVVIQVAEGLRDRLKPDWAYRTERIASGLTYLVILRPDTLGGPTFV